MEDFIFFEGDLGKDIVSDYEVSLYNLQEHRAIQSSGKWVSFYVLREKKNVAVAEIHFEISDTVASSPLRSPFGSIDCSQDINPMLLFKFLEFIEARLHRHGVQKITIKNPPVLYHPRLLSILEPFLLNRGYQIKIAEVSAIYTVARPFDELAKEKRKRKQATEKDLELRFHEIGMAREVYDFVVDRRKQKGYITSTTFEILHRTILKFPERFVLNSVYQSNVRVAASISIRSTSQVLYHFYSDHNRSDDGLNPTVFLIKGLYEYALTKNIRFLDLGTSSVSGLPNFGLLNFKLRLGADPVTKYTFEKTLTS